MKLTKTLLIVLLLAVIAAPALFFISTNDEASSSGSVEVDLRIPEFNSEAERIEEIKKVCDKYCGTKALKKIECRYNGYDGITNKDGEIELNFYELIDDSKEGGNVSTATVHYKTADNRIYKIGTFNGPGKQGGFGGEDLVPDKWNMTVNGIVDRFVEQYTAEKLARVKKPYLKISILNDKATCMLFSEEENGHIEKASYSLNENR